MRLVLTPLKKSKKFSLRNTAGTLSLQHAPQADSALSAKTLRTAAFYPLPALQKKAVTSENLLSGLPLSSYLEEGLYTLCVTFTTSTGETQTLLLPLTVIPKEFVHETIPLDDRNTSIKTNYSKERIDQINRLNAILEARNTENIFSLNAFQAPTPATRRTSFFADRRIYAYSSGKSATSLHYGIDYGVPEGSEVRACADGKVVLAEDRISTGWSVCIEHLPGLYSLYYHMSTLEVAVGDRVHAGDKIGRSGATGLATGPHLHWEVRLNTEAVSPDFFTHDFTFEKTVRATFSDR